MSILSALRSAFGEFRGQLSHLRRSIEELQQQREDIIAAPLPKSDIKRLMEHWLEHNAQAFETALGEDVGRVANLPKLRHGDMNALQTIAARQTFLCSQGPLTRTEGTAKTVELALSALLLPVIRTELSKAIDRAPWTSPEGLPMEARAKKLAEIDAKLEKLVAEEASLMREAAASGVVVD